jgi:nucleoside-diphosphate-sugar epimerase
MNPTVLVTGANGYTGGNLCRYLAARGIPVRAMYWAPDGKPEFCDDKIHLVAGDLRDRDGLGRILEGIDIVYNIAALYRPTNVSNKMYWDVNVEGTRNIVELAAEANAKRFVHCSTIGVHGTIENPPATEDAPLAPDDYYQFTKLKGEQLCREIGQETGMPVAIVRPAAIYGPRERRFFTLTRLIQKGRFVMFGKGDVLYHFIHIDDLCEAFLRCAESPAAVGQTYIVADDHAISLNKVIEILAKTLNVAPPRIRLPLFVLYAASIACEFACKPFGLSPPLHRRRASWFSSDRSFDINKIRSELGFMPKFTPDAGLADMVRSYREAGWLP